MIPILCWLLWGAPADSSVLSAADSLLGRSDTLAAVDRLQSHADTARVSREVVDLLDRLVLPDWPAPQVPDTLAAGDSTHAVGRSPTARARRPWWMVSTRMGRDEGGELPFWWSMQVVRRSWLSWPGWSGHWEWGGTQLGAEASSGRLMASEALVRGEIQRGHWLGAAQVWAGLDQDLAAQAGVGGSLSRVDSFRLGRLAMGPEWRLSNRHASWMGLALRWEEPHGLFLSGAARWRRDPRFVLEQGKNRYEAEADRHQFVASASWIATLGAWRLGPSVDFDGTASSGADLWVDSMEVRRVTRRESTWSAGVIAAVAGANRWSVRLRPSWVFSRAKRAVGATEEVEVDGLRVALDGVLVF